MKTSKKMIIIAVLVMLFLTCLFLFIPGKHLNGEYSAEISEEGETVISLDIWLFTHFPWKGRAKGTVLIKECDGSGYVHQREYSLMSYVEPSEELYLSGLGYLVDDNNYGSIFVSLDLSYSRMVLRETPSGRTIIAASTK